MEIPGFVGRIHHEGLVVEILDCDALGIRQRMLFRDRGEQGLGDDAAAGHFGARDWRPQQAGVDLAGAERLELVAGHHLLQVLVLQFDDLVSAAPAELEVTRPTQRLARRRLHRVVTFTSG